MKNAFGLFLKKTINEVKTPLPDAESKTVKDYNELLKGDNTNEEVKKFPLAPMGVLAPVSAHAGPSAQPPIGTSGNFPARVSAELPSNISPNPSEVISKVSEVYDNF